MLAQPVLPSLEHLRGMLVGRRRVGVVVGKRDIAGVGVGIVGGDDDYDHDSQRWSCEFRLSTRFGYCGTICLRYEV